MGKPKIKDSFHKLSQKRLRLTIQCYMLSTKLRFWTTVVFGLAQFFSQQFLCELPITQYCVVGVGYTYISDKHWQCFLNSNWNSQDIQSNVLRFLLQNKLLDTLVRVPHVPVQQGTAAGVCGRSRLVCTILWIQIKMGYTQLSLTFFHYYRPIWPIYHTSKKIIFWKNGIWMRFYKWVLNMALQC